ncbi:hypothetical protein [Kitasatospora sp. NPDC093102]|uniref:hypothetical protein n=1 Tax=Kitasatospora sp. NPDC093102 TaxID=3155069 RepID=UPI00342CBB94
MKSTLKVADGQVTVAYEQRICVRCVLPESFPGVEFDDLGVCTYCADESERIEIDRGLITAAVAEAKAAAEGGNYDALVLYSGGKDSSLALARTVGLGLRTLAFTLDNGYLSNAAGRNVANVLDALGVDHVRFRPPGGLMKRLYRTSLDLRFDDDTIKYSTGGCGSCISMVLASAVRTAAAHGIPLLVGGWTPGQFTTSPVVDQPFLVDVMSRHFAPLGEASEELRRDLESWHPDRLGVDGIRLLNPLYAEDYTEQQTLDALAELGWRRPDDTDSCSTNCRLNGLLILDHIERFGFHPYVYELAHHVRIGASSREEALAKMAKVDIKSSQVEAISVDLGIPSVLDAKRR